MPLLQINNVDTEAYNKQTKQKKKKERTDRQTVK